ncbi:excinuclease ABC subunit UvrA, partial [Wenyingzhuangia sp. 1_MG-2023]|nr:excinuclease ABC subunit UvrA [Wenyingzhuangia sp. 1_MG-2023]
GYVRVRIDGRIYDLDDTPDLDKRRKHSIEVVVDRFKVKPGLEQRLSESIETCLELSGGLALVTPMDDDDAEPLLFSSQFSCPHCGYSLSELEPRLFSF